MAMAVDHRLGVGGGRRSAGQRGRGKPKKKKEEEAEKKNRFDRFGLPFT